VRVAGFVTVIKLTHEKEHGAPIANKRENKIYRLFMDGERYQVDLADDFQSGGWAQFDTDQDAPYFGVWVNKTKLQTLTYAEGDWVLVECQDAEHYDAEIASMIEFYAEGHIAKALDDNGQWTMYRQDRKEFFINPPKEEVTK
jgi:hypothetical protein